MAIIKSRTVPGQAAALALAGVDRAARMVEERIAAAREEGRMAGDKAARAELQPRIDAAERKAKEAQAQADARVQAAEQALDERLGKAVAAFERANSQFSVLEKQATAAAEAELVRLALAVAARVLRREIAADPAWMAALAADALREVPDRREVVLRLEPSDAAQLRARLRSIAAAVPGVEQLTVQDDPLAHKGTCVLVCRGTRLDASVPSSWERVADAVLAEAPAPPLAVRDDGSAPDIAPGTDPTAVPQAQP